LLIAALLAAFMAVSVRNRLSQTPVAEAPAPTARIVVAKRDLALGTFVQGAQDLDWGPVPPDVVAQNAAAAAALTAATAPTDDGSTPAAPPAVTAAVAAAAAKDVFMHEGSVKLTDFNGAVVRHSLRAGDPVTQTTLMKSGEGGFMSAVLSPGMRAVSISVNPTSGNAGFVSPGDHVDLIVTHHIKTISSGANGTEESVVSETFVHDVRVVAVDQMLDNPDSKAILAKTVTVEVTPRQAEQVSVGAEMGKISIALRSVAISDAKPKTDAKADKDDTHDNAHTLADIYGADDAGQPRDRDSGYTRDADLSQLLGHKSASAPRVLVIRGDKSETVDFYQDKQ